MRSKLILGAVYPRWRGEHGYGLARFCDGGGLSPLARGTRFRLLFFEEPDRFIPAGAGNTSFEASWFFLRSVYPRWRGEHVNAIIKSGQNCRFIPAGAGNTDI